MKNDFSVRSRFSARLFLGVALASSTLLASPTFAGSRQCGALFTSVPELPAHLTGRITWSQYKVREQGSGRVFVRSGTFESFEESTRGLKISFDYIRQVSRIEMRPSAVLIHGVLDRREDLAGVTRELESRGWDILAVDLLGHGRSAELNQLKSIDHTLQVQILSALTRNIHARFDLQRPVIIGHSLGGGISMSLALNLNQRNVAPLANIPVAPYLSAIDKFLFSRGLSPDVLRHYNEQLISQLGLKGVSDFYSKSPYIEMWRTFFRIMFEPALVASNSEQARQFMSIMNAINDPVAKKVLDQAYHHYQDAKNKQRADIDKLTNEQIDRLVAGGIAATYGAKSLDFQARRNPTPVDPKVPTLLISGDQDPVVIPPQVRDFKVVAERAGYDVTFLEMKGDHFIPQRSPIELTDIILEYLFQRNLLERPSK